MQSRILNILVPLAVTMLWQGCGVVKGGRDRYEFSATVKNESEYILNAQISYNERSVADECRKSAESIEVEVDPGETEELSIVALCHVGPSAGVTVTFPISADIEKRSYMFNANTKIACSNSGCALE